MIEQLKAGARRRLPRVYQPLRAWHVRRLVSEFTPRTVKHTYAGFDLTVALEDPLAEGWYDHDWPAPPEIDALLEGRLREGARVIDIGAHQAVVALILARIVGPEGLVVAVEAEAHNVAVARRNAEANNAGNLLVLHAAGAATCGTVSFTESLNGVVATDGAIGTVEVEAVTVDELARRHGRPDVVLVDVEGYEAHVLDGARETIASGSTDFFVELHNAASLEAAGSTADEVLSRFLGGPFDIAIAIADDALPGYHNARPTVTWKDASSMIHRHGLRCFVVARAHG